MTSGDIPRAEQVEDPGRRSHMPRSPSPEHRSSSQMMDEGPIMEVILSLTLEIMYVLTGENSILVKRGGKYARPQLLMCGRRNEEKVLELTKKIIELLTGEEERARVEGHKDLYEDVMAESDPAPRSRTDIPESRKVPAGNHSDSVTGKRCDVPEESTSSKACKADDKRAGNAEADLLSRRKRVMPDKRRGPRPSNSRTMEDSITCNGGEPDSGAADNGSDQAKAKKPTFAQDLQKDLPVIQIKEELSSCDEDFANTETLTVAGPDPMDCASPGIKVSDDFQGPHISRTSGFTGPDQEDGDMEDTRGLPDNGSEIMSSRGSLSGGKTWQCSYCLKAFANTKQLKVHIKSHPNQKPLKCSECGKCFSKKSELVAHHRVHTGEKPFACPECGKQFADRANVIAHQAIHEQPASSKTELLTREKLSQIDQAPVLCSECGMSFKNSKVLAEHQKSHKPEKMFVCSVCGKGFTKRGHLGNHSRIHSGAKRTALSESRDCAPQTRKRPFLCFECGKCFPSRSHLDRHQRVHTGEKPFSCSECDKRFTDRSGLVIHQRIHTGEKPYSCHDCGKCFRDRSGLVVHQRNHTGQQPFRCLECGKCFHNRARLERHAGIHTGEKSYSCPECKQTFPSVSVLTTHYQGHFGDAENVTSQAHPQGQPRCLEDQTSVACSECGKAFKEFSTLSAHYRTHIAERRRIPPGESFTGADLSQKANSTEKLSSLSNVDQTTLARERGRLEKREFSCSRCDQSFLDRASFITHERQHTGEKPYTCPKCGECFVLKGYLTKHLETHE